MGERHVVQRAHRERWGIIADDSWSLDMCGQIISEQEGLLLAGIRCLKLGGTLVYSTCSLDWAQNDGVVGRVLSIVNTQGRYVVKPVKIDNSFVRLFEAQIMTYGVVVMPDTSYYGPLYVCKLQKVELTD
eukprot:TRINITY_DN68180_c2_g1_i2.p4 TRINITY_DN68180_c2_g1~~TRINITY_DN68180_c2_g1_i2.p4  ORF type:complete len:130 (+),score=18.59 TRINITY_DN68180_c2_g1_i2:381-770(+)